MRRKGPREGWAIGYVLLVSCDTLSLPSDKHTAATGSLHSVCKIGSTVESMRSLSIQCLEVEKLDKHRRNSARASKHPSKVIPNHFLHFATCLRRAQLKKLESTIQEAEQERQAQLKELGQVFLIRFRSHEDSDQNLLFV